MVIINKFHKINIAAQFIETAEFYPDKIALIYNEERYTFDKLKRLKKLVVVVGAVETVEKSEKWRIC